MPPDSTENSGKTLLLFDAVGMGNAESKSQTMDCHFSTIYLNSARVHIQLQLVMKNSSSSRFKVRPRSDR